jgi:phenylacetate-CoA ligase
MNFHDSLTVKALRILPAYKAFRDMYKFLQKSQYWSRDQLEEYQLQRLSKLLNHAYENVPYYRKVFDERGLKPKDIQDFSDLRKLPVLTKEIIQENFNDLKARNYPEKKFEYVTTGGSTGIPLGFYYEKNVSRAIEMAFMKTQWDRVGYSFKDKCVVLRGNVVKSAGEGKFWETAMLRRWLILSSYHMTDKNLPKYIDKIRKFKPKFIQAYPSAITILARFMKENNIAPFSTVKALLLGSENLYSWQRELLEEVLQCRVYSWYGNTEQTVLAGECEVSSYYHIFPEYGIVELIGNDGKPVTKENELGEVISTGLNNFVFPLIRYRTMDLATLANKKCKCGRDYQLLKNVEGRLQEFIVTGTGRLISMTAINMHSNVFDNVKQFQFYQEKKGEVFFNIVKKQTYTHRDTEYIRRELYKKLGDDVNLIIRFVDHIPLTRRGKYRFLIQKLPIGFGDVGE